MTKIIIQNSKEPERIDMGKMPPGSIGIIRSPGGTYDGHVVRRTLHTTRFLVEDLSTNKESTCWDGCNSIPVEIVNGAEIIINLYP